MNEVTVSVAPVVPPHPGGSLPCVKGLEPAMRFQKLNLQGMRRISRAVRISGHHTRMADDTALLAGTQSPSDSKQWRASIVVPAMT